MNLQELEAQYGPLPETLDRKKMEQLLKKRDNKNALLTVPLVDAVEEWLESSEIEWNRTFVHYAMLDGTTESLTGLEVNHANGKLIIVLVEDYSKFNKKVVHKGVAGTIHFDLINKGYRVVWCKKFEWETPRKRTVMQSLILHTLGKTPNRYYARKTVCEIVEPKSLTNFFNESSFYGARGASQAVVLKDKDTGEVLQALSFGNNFYGKTKYGENTVECIRSAGKPFSVVAGGMSKLMKFYIEKFGDTFDKVIYYVDDAHFQSDSMDSVTFEYSHFAPNGVHNVWPETGAIFPRTPMLHKEIMYLQKLGLIMAVPDVGNSTYVFDKKQFNESV